MADIQDDRTKPRAALLRHFAKGLLFKPFGAPQEGIPEYSMSVDLKTSHAEAANYELELRLRIEAGRAAERLYQLELAYAGIFALRNVAQADLTRLMLIDAPSLLFPFARKLAGETMRNAGFAPLAIKAVDFAALYLGQKEEVPPPFGGELAAPGEVRELFPTHLYSAPLGVPLRSAVEAACLELAATDGAGRDWCKANAYRGYTSYATVRDLPAQAPAFAALVKQLDRHAANFAAAAEFDMRGRRLVLDGIWINVMEEGGMHASHVHPHSAISGTYYVTMPGGAGAICYEDPRSPLMMSAPPRAAEARTENKAFVSVNPKEDTLLLWESWLRHGVEMQTGRTARISISFNYRIEAADRMP
ncbi:MAG TPA: protein-export chaperone SecB [Rhizomicrobium sp.]|nr:protein-export chaperone SecB [Rhizomicrobium sp.]